MRSSLSILLVLVIIGRSQVTPADRKGESKIVGGVFADHYEFPYFGKQKLGAHSFLSKSTHFRGITLNRRRFYFKTRSNQKLSLVAIRGAVVH